MQHFIGESNYIANVFADNQNINQTITRVENFSQVWMKSLQKLQKFPPEAICTAVQVREFKSSKSLKVYIG